MLEKNEVNRRPGEKKHSQMWSDRENEGKEKVTNSYSIRNVPQYDV